jgi:hypothetical protein
VKYIELPEPLPEPISIEAAQIENVFVHPDKSGDATLSMADPAGGCGQIDIATVKAKTNPRIGDYWVTDDKSGHLVPKDEFEARYIPAQ